MRIWSLHPEYLDAAGLVACWRETLLAQKVLRGLTVGYRSHPQLTRFREQADPVAAVATYLHGIADEADRRGYHFDRTRIVQPPDPTIAMTVTDGQLDYERTWLLSKLAERSPDVHERVAAITPLATHPLFSLTPGPIAVWEKV